MPGEEGKRHLWCNCCIISTRMQARMLHAYIAIVLVSVIVCRETALHQEMRGSLDQAAPHDLMTAIPPNMMTANPP